MKQKTKLPEKNQPLLLKVMGYLGFRKKTLSYSGDSALITSVAQEVARNAVLAVEAGMVDTSKFDSMDHTFFQASPSRYTNYVLTDSPLIGGIYIDVAYRLDRRVDVLAANDLYILASQTTIKELFGYRFKVSRKIKLTHKAWMSRKLAMVGRLGCRVRIDADGNLVGVGDTEEETLFLDVVEQITALKNKRRV